MDDWKNSPVNRKSVFTNSIAFKNCIHCHCMQIPGFKFCQKILWKMVQRSCHTEQLYWFQKSSSFGKHSPQSVFIKTEYLDQIRKMEAVFERLAFEYYLRELTSDSAWKFNSCYCKLRFMLLNSKHKTNYSFIIKYCL